MTNPGTRYAYFLAQVMPKFMGNFDMTFAKKWTYRAPKIHRNGNESTFRQNIGHSNHLPYKQQKATWAHSYIGHLGTIIEQFKVKMKKKSLN